MIIGGVVESVRFQKTQNGRMIILMLSDATGSQEVTVYSELYDMVRDIVKDDAVLLIEAKVRTVRRGGDDGELTLSLRITAEKIYDVTGARGRFARRLRLSMNGEASAARLKQLLAPYRSGPCAVSVEYRNGRARCELALGDDWRVTPDDKLIRSLHEWLRPENVEFLYA